MSSGERAKPPGAYQERNPFDVSRRSQTEVAAEIANRMAAWKQARTRPSATPAAAASAKPSDGGAKAQHLAAPVQPARMPKPAASSAAAPEPAQAGRVEAKAAPRTPAAAAPTGGGDHAPFFATFSIQRAMPPAPSPKRPPARTQPAAETDPAAAPTEGIQPVVAPEAVAPEPAPHSPVTARADDAPPAAAGGPADSDSLPIETQGPIQEALTDQPLDNEPAQPAVPAVDPHEADEPAAPEVAATAPADESGTMAQLRAKAHDIKARWMAAHDIETPAEESNTGTSVVTERETSDRGKAIGAADKAPNGHDDFSAPAMPPLESLDSLSGRREPTFDRPTEPEPRTPATSTAAAQDDKPAVARTEPISSLTIEALESLSGRREPTFDEPAARSREARRAPPTAPQPETPRQAQPPQPKRPIDLPTMQTRIEARRIEVLRADPEMAADRSRLFPHVEPEVWEVLPPVPTSVEAKQHKMNWAIGLGTVMLLVGLTAPAAILQQMRDQAEKVAVIVNPAATRPQGQAGQPALPVAPTPEQATTQAPATESTQATAQPPGPATPPAPTTGDSEVAAPSAPTAAGPQVANLPKPVVKPGTGEASPKEAAPEQDPALVQEADLGAIQDGGDLDKAPISAPPPQAPLQASSQSPTVNLASRQEGESSGAFSRSPMTARPFVPEPKPGQFLRVPTTGAASVPIDGAPAVASQGTPAGGASSTGLRPALIPQLKPDAPAARAGSATPQRPSPAPSRVARPSSSFFPTPFERILDSVADTIGEGKPPNPALRQPRGGKE